MLIYKVFHAAEWSNMRQDGRSSGAPVDLSDGYIHFSTAQQLPVTLSKHFKGDEGLMLLACDADKLGPRLRWEPSRGGALFPHLYRPLTLADIQWTRPISLTESGHVRGVLE